MKVLRTTAAGGLALGEAPEPRIGDGEALADLVLCGLCGTDLHKLEDPRQPAGDVLGHEVVVRIADSRSDALAPGDRVAAPHHAPCGDCRLCRAGAETMCPDFAENLLDPGGFSERLRLGARAVRHTVRRLPSELGDEAAVFLEPAACVLRSVDRAGLAGDTPEVTVIGAGSMGLLHLLVLRAVFPGARLVAAEPDPGRRAIALELGADVALPPAEVDEAARTDASAGGADAVFDTAGGQDALDLALGATRAGGRVVLFAHAGRDPQVSLDIDAVFRGERQVIGACSSTPAEQARAFDLLRSGALDPTPLVSHRLPLNRADEAVRLYRSRAALKVLLHP